MSKSKYCSDYMKLLINEGLVDKVREIKRDIYKDSKSEYQVINVDEEGVVDIERLQCYSKSEWLCWLNEYKKQSKYDCALRVIQSEYRKALKVREKISNIVMNNNAIFITLTFRDDVFASTSSSTRRRYVSRFLKQFCKDYVANIDFSPDMGREHYHAVIDSRVDFSAWKYGFLFTEQIRAHDHDMKRVSKYITKLTNHALKVDGDHQRRLVGRLIYSRT